MRAKPDTGKLLELRPQRRDTSEFFVWRLVPPKGVESCRWEAFDGRWITLALGHESDIGKVVVACSDGRRELIEDYEAALSLARAWRV